MNMSETPVPPSPGALELSSVVRSAVGGLARRLRSEGPGQGVSVTKLSVLGRLFRLGPLSGAELASLERIQPQSLTRVLAELEGSGFISRRADEKDGRRQLLGITGNGRALLIRDMRQRDAWLAVAMSAGLSPTEQELLRLAAQLMDRLADAPGPAVRAAGTEIRI
jgi:DNA-binding MarR family transcriptional regulator